MEKPSDGAVKQVESLVSTFTKDRVRYVSYVDALVVLVRRLCLTTGLNADISGRAKDLESLRRKIQSKGYRQLEQVPDLAGLRVIVQYQTDVETICQLLSREFQIVEQVTHRFARPDSFGYVSRHLVLGLNESRCGLTEWAQFEGLVCEFQVRTILQHAWATISHSLDYKSEADVPETARRKLFQVAALIEVGDGLFDQFRSERQAIKGAYEASTTNPSWRQVPVDVDALVATLSEWIDEDVGKRLSDQGVNMIDVSDLFFSQNAPYPDPALLSQVTSLSSALGIRTIGELVTLLTSPSTVESFDRHFRPDGAYSLDYVHLLILYAAARRRGIEIPSDVEIQRLDGSFTWADADPTS